MRLGSIYATLGSMETVGIRTPACYLIGGSKPRAGHSSGLMNVVLFSLAISISASAGSLASNNRQARPGMPVAGARIYAPQPRMAVQALSYTGYRPEGVREDRGPVYSLRSRQNQASVTEDPANNVARARTEEPGAQSDGANLSVASRSLSAQGAVQKPLSLPPGVKPQVTTPAERSQATGNINQKFQQAENKMANKPWDRPDRRNRLEQSRVYFIGLIDWGYPLALLDTWCDDLLDDQVDVGMPIGLVDSYWGDPVSTQDYVEYYNPYETCTYQTPDGNYRQVTFQNGVVTQPM
jgi:hypothetical protein